MVLRGLTVSKCSSFTAAAVLCWLTAEEAGLVVVGGESAWWRRLGGENGRGVSICW